jgi:hypothetical protein
MLDNLWVDTKPLQQFLSDLTASLNTLVEFGIADVMQQCGKLDHKRIAANLRMDSVSRRYHSTDMIKTMTCRLIGKAVSNFVADAA